VKLLKDYLVNVQILNILIIIIIISSTWLQKWFLFFTII